MNLDKKTRLAAELADLAQQKIEVGRFPFRRAESTPRLLTEQGEISPSLVLWINRDSFMAGGIVLLDDQAPEQCFAAGSASASALGLSHFVTWSVVGLDIWHCQTGRPPQRIRHLEAPAPDNALAEESHQVLQHVLEELKPLSVMGAVAPENLDAFYLANLCLSPLAAAEEELTEAVSSARAKTLDMPNYPARRLAQSKGMLVLVRLLALMRDNQIPENVRPEKLERAIDLVLSYLSEPVVTALGSFPAEPPLPYPSAVRFHHLFRRLGQLRWGSDPKKVGKVLEILLRDQARRLGLPFWETTEPVAEGTLLINPASARPAGTFSEAFQDPALKALVALLRDHLDLPHAQESSTNIFSLQMRSAPRNVEGGLVLLSEKITAAEREFFRLKLRTSWPNRRLSLAPKSPRYIWEAAHLFGLAADGAAIRLTLPAAWLVHAYGNSFYNLITEQFSIVRLETLSPSQLCLTLEKQPGLSCETTLCGPCGSRTFNWHTLRQQPRSFLNLALRAPDCVLELLQQQKLSFNHGAEVFAAPPGIERFFASQLGSYLWKSLAPGHPLPGSGQVASECRRHLVPLPDPDLLQQLAALPEPDTEKIEEAIRQKLGEFSGLPAPELPPGSEESATQRSKRIREEETAQIISDVFKDGVPRFPENYLYDIYRPELQKFEVNGTLHQTNEFLGVFELTDSSGQVIQVEGEETARALELATFSEQTLIELPTDRHLTASIVERYLADLNRLQQDLLHQTYSRRDESRLARQWARRIWNSLPLPPWEELDEPFSTKRP